MEEITYQLRAVDTTTNVSARARIFYNSPSRSQLIVHSVYQASQV
jgi:hypothetical protein